MYSLFERSEDGYEFEIRDLRRDSEEMVFMCFITNKEIVRADFENVDKMYNDFYNEVEPWVDYDVQQFCWAKWRKTVDCEGCKGNSKCEFFRGDYYNCYSLHTMYGILTEVKSTMTQVLKVNFEHFKLFSIGNADMPEIFYAEDIFPSWFGFDKGKVDYNYMLLKLCGEVNGRAKYIIKKI